MTELMNCSTSNSIPMIDFYTNISNHKSLIFIAGPCVIESQDFLLNIAKELKNIFRERAKFIFKASFDKANRQSLSSFRGLGMAEGLRALQLVKQELNIPILTDIHEPHQAAEVSQIVDVLQIPAFLCRQTDLLVAAARTGKSINVKKGQFVSPLGMSSVIKKLKEAGARHIFITERGYSFGYGDLIADMRGLAQMKKYQVPIFFDATHSVQRQDMRNGTSGGDREFVEPLARAATAVGIAGIFLEVHPDPQNAKSDPATQWPLSKLPRLIDQILAIDLVIKGDARENFS